ncbi:MAG: hypothetical protein JSS81_06960 [Acidobacteria bacterium]|nr:hypothetical protein [Acidobacteriota bacterium]
MRFIKLFLLISIFSAAAAAQPKKIYLPFTKNLPKIDKVRIYELYQADLEGMDRTRNGEILAEVTLRAAPARKVAAVWRKLEYRPGLSACHEPHYSVEFYARGRLIVRASVCWACDNIFFSVPRLFKQVDYEHNTQNFLADGKYGQRLAEIFKAAFASKPEKQSKSPRFGLYVLGDFSRNLGEATGTVLEKLEKAYREETPAAVISVSEIESVGWKNTMGLLDPIFTLTPQASKKLPDLNGKGYAIVFDGEIVFRGVIVEDPAAQTPSLPRIVPRSKNGKLILASAPLLAERTSEYEAKIGKLRRYFRGLKKNR